MNKTLKFIKEHGYEKWEVLRQLMGVERLNQTEAEKRLVELENRERCPFCNGGKLKLVDPRRGKLYRFTCTVCSRDMMLLP